MLIDFQGKGAECVNLAKPKWPPLRWQELELTDEELADLLREDFVPLSEREKAN